MVSLWGSKNKDNQNGNGNGNGNDEAAHEGESSPTPRRPRAEPDERTRLLDNPPPPRGGYLDPDDPAVSPYNLWSVKIIRVVTSFLTMVTFIWWVLLLVSIFVSPPGLSTRGSGFTDFSYACLSLGTLLMALIFFIIPSQAARISLSVMGLLLFIDMLIILSVTRIRYEEGGPGIASSVWALVVTIWCIMTDRVVAWGKREEEERLTGRPELRRTLKQWTGVFLATLIAVIYIFITVLMTATLILRAVDAGLAPDGNRYAVDGDKYKVHVNCVGNATTDHVSGEPAPTVLLEAGEVPLEYDFEDWLYNSQQNGTIERYCYWDRPGYAWSENAPSPHSAGMSADALSEALAVAGEKGPFISVSAGYGSIVARIFIARHPGKIGGIMLIDPLHEDLLHRISSSGRGFTLWGYGILSPLGISRLAGAIFKGRTKEDRVYGNSVWSTGKFLKAKLQENLIAESLSKSEVSSARNIMSKRTPLVVISSGVEVGKDSEWDKKQKDLSKLTKRLISWDIVNKAPHEVWKTKTGRDLMEKRLGELVKAAKSALDSSDGEDEMIT